MDILGKIIAAILMVFLLFVNPLQFLWESENTIESSYIQSLETEFVDEVCNVGKVTLERYEQLKTNIIQTGKLYDVEMEHTHIEVGAVLDELSEKAEIQHMKARKSVADVNLLSLAASASPSHVHTSDCYAYISSTKDTSHVCNSNNLRIYYSPTNYNGYNAISLVITCRDCGNRYYSYVGIPNASSSQAHYDTNGDIASLSTYFPSYTQRDGKALSSTSCNHYYCNILNPKPKETNFRHALADYASYLNAIGIYNYPKLVPSERYKDCPLELDNPTSPIYYYDTTFTEMINKLVSFGYNSSNGFLPTSCAFTIDYNYSNQNCTLDTSEYSHVIDLYTIKRYINIDMNAISLKVINNYNATSNDNIYLMYLYRENMPSSSQTPSKFIVLETDNVIKLNFCLSNYVQPTICGEMLDSNDSRRNDFSYWYTRIISLLSDFGFEAKQLGDTIYAPYLVKEYDYSDWSSYGNGYGYYYSYNLKGAPLKSFGAKQLVCDRIITKIEAVAPQQTVKQYDSIDLRATVTYRNGGTEVVTCTSSFNTNTVGNNQTATLYYNGYASAKDVTLDSKTTFYTTVKVNVQSKKTFSSITVNLSKTTIDLYEAFPITSVTLHYDNGETETVTSGWSITGFNNSVGGSQTVTVSYTKGTIKKSTTTTIFIRKLQSIHANISSTTIPINSDISITNVILTYNNNATKTVTSGWSISGFNKAVGGSQTVKISYTENGITVSENIRIYVRKLQSIQANLSQNTVRKYTELPVSSLTLTYNNGMTQTVTSGWTYSGYNPNARGVYNVTIYYEEGGVTYTTNVTITVTNLLSSCPFCGSSYYCDDADNDQGCPYCKDKIDHLDVTPTFLTVQRGGTLDIEVSVVYQDGHDVKVSRWTSDFNPNQLGGQVVTIQYQGLQAKITVRVVVRKLCPYCNHYYEYDNESESACPFCSKQIVSLSAMPNDLKVDYGEQLDITVTATYRDGHTQVITDYESTYDRYSIGTQYVSISHGSISTQITVEVIKPSITCPICHREYDASINTTGCPYCRTEIISIHASLINSGTKVQLGSELILRVVVEYRDTHREAKYSGYTVEGYDCNQLGEQTVRVYYQTHSCTLTIEVVNELKKVVCPNGHVYYLNADGSDPGCPYCVAELSDKEMSYLKICYTDEILEKLETEGEYVIPSGDYISIKIRRRETRNSGNPLRQLTSIDVLYVKKEFVCGGEVK